MKIVKWQKTGILAGFLIAGYSLRVDALTAATLSPSVTAAEEFTNQALKMNAFPYGKGEIRGAIGRMATQRAEEPSNLPSSQPVRKPSQAFVTPSEKVQLRSFLQPHLYVFKGKAADEEHPLPNAVLWVRVITPHAEQIIKLRTNAEGGYTARMPLMVALNEPVSWEVIAETPSKNIQVAGAHIHLEEDGAVTTVNP